MKRAKVMTSFAVLSISFLFILPANAFAADYRIEWWNVTNRIYADHRGKVNKLQFAVTDAQGNYI